MGASKRSRYWRSLPRFIWGEALDAQPGGLDERLFLTHTRFPRFVCEIYETDEIPEVDSLEGNLVGTWQVRQGERIWQCNAGFFAARWAYIDAVPTLEQLHAVMLDAAMDYQFFTEANETALRESGHE